ncbi:hypothetical protein AMATHDRAFT_159063, partial [Amanita thiersii Skay4041]
DVVHVDAHPSFSYFVPENVVHHGLELSQPKEHNKRFEESPVGSECGLPLVSLFYSDIIVAPSYVHL